MLFAPFFKIRPAKSDFLANMSHEIRTPMNAVLGFTELLDALITDPRQKSYLGSIKSGGKSLLTLINDILDLSKIEAGKLEIRYEPVDPRLIFNEIEHIFSLKIARKNLDYSTVIDPQIPEGLVLDEVRLRQVLMNLVGNALKFTERGFIKLTVNHLNPDTDNGKIDLRITVEDTGVGIPQAERESIFESFEQRKDQSRREFGGTGLGLSICKRLVELMGGVIYVDSEPGQGSAFKITLRNVAIAETDALPAENGQHADIIFEKCTILAVDDIEYNLNMVKEYFADTNVTVIGAENGEKALLYAREYKPDLIIMDLSMPVMDGYEATRHIKADAELQHIPVIVVTASSLQDKNDEMEQHGFDGYMRKPISRAALFQKMSRFLKFSTGDESDEPEETLAKLIPPETIARLPEVIAALEQDLMTQWKEFERIQPVKAVEKFGEDLNALGERYNLEILKEFGADLTDCIHNFDIKSMQNRLAEFPDLIDKLKSV